MVAALPSRLAEKAHQSIEILTQSPKTTKAASLSGRPPRASQVTDEGYPKSDLRARYGRAPAYFRRKSPVFAGIAMVATPRERETSRDPVRTRPLRLLSCTSAL